jgi:septum formation protein
MRLPVIYLASQSPRRQQLLTQIGVSFELLLPADAAAAEALEAELPGESPLSYVKRVTLLKLHAAQQLINDNHLMPRPVLCADTTVALGQQVLGKPQDRLDAVRMLRILSGQTHEVFTAVALQSGRRSWCSVQRSRVTFDTLSEADIAAYVDSGEPMGKAGAYAIQGKASAFIKRILGSHSGIMGLPLFETSRLLKRIAKE